MDTFGICGRKKCRKNSDCEETLTRDYKFYLAFENSVCQEYVTEKFFLTLQRFLVLPIVLSRSVVSKLAPNHSFIAVDDFESPQELAKYLLYLDRNPEIYLTYFWWRREFRVSRGLWLCDLCVKLWSEDFTSTSNYANVDLWFRNASTCKDNFAMKFLPPSFGRQKHHS